MYDIYLNTRILQGQGSKTAQRRKGVLDRSRLPPAAPSKKHLHSEVLFYVDCCCRGLGAGAGNTQTEVLCAVLQRMGYNTGVNLYDIQDVAEDLVEPIMRRPQEKKNN